MSIRGFSRWNDRLLEVFFGPATAGQPVRLNVSADLLDSEFLDLGGSRGFKQAVREGPDWATGYSNESSCWVWEAALIDRALGLWRQWSRSRKRHPKYVAPPNEAPPYLPYLCMLSYAWTIGYDDLAANNYYNRLDQVYPGHGLRSHPGSLQPLWEGLEQWSVLHEGRLGRFEVEQLGGMQWVGVPKAQVIFTAARVEAFPSFFWRLGLVPEMRMPESQLRELILQNEVLSRQCLGQSLFSAIEADAGIGRAALEQLRGYLALWDGDVEGDDHVGYDGRGSPGDEGQSRAVANGGRFLLALRPDQENEYWEGEVHLRRDDMPNGVVRLQYKNQQWSAPLIDGSAGPFRDDLTHQLLRPDKLLAAGEPFNASLVWSEDVDGEAEFKGSWSPRNVYCLQWHDGVLLDQGVLPSIGDAYVFLNDVGMDSLRRWISCIDEARRPSLRIEDIPQQGLPVGWQLGYLSALGELHDDEWRTFPSADNVPRKRHRLLGLRGGTRARRNGIRRVYAAYDLPKVVLRADDGVQIQAIGAELEEITRANSLPTWLPLLAGPSTRAYRFLVARDSSIVAVQAMRGNTELARLSFAVARSAEDSASRGTRPFKLDPFGAATLAEEGTFGLAVAGDAAGWEMGDGAYCDGVELPEHADFDRPGHLFLEWLATRQQVPFALARDFSIERLLAEGVRSSPSREIRMLAQLAHLEVRCDSRGRWATVHAVPAAAYVLPVKRHGLWQGVLGGTYTRNQAMLFVNAARDLGLRVEVQPQAGLEFVPPRLCVLAESADELWLAADTAEVAWHEVPPAWAYANWAGHVDDWAESLFDWASTGTSDAGSYTAPVATYRPCEFRTRDGDQWAPWGNCKLARHEDRVTRSHFQYTLLRRRGDQVRQSYVSQRAWATWFVHREVMHGLLQGLGQIAEFNVPIAYIGDHTGAVVVPQELELPLVLARSLALCSGFAPSLVTSEQCDAYSEVVHGFTPGQRYTGYCLAYPSIHPEIARVVLGKLGAIPQLYSDKERRSRRPNFTR